MTCVINGVNNETRGADLFRGDIYIYIVISVLFFSVSGLDQTPEERAWLSLSHIW